MKNEFKCGICGDGHSSTECDLIPFQCHIVDKPILSKARQTLPDELEVLTLADTSYTVSSKYLIEKGTKFGPLDAKKMCTLLPSIQFPLKIFSDDETEFSECYLDTTNEDECNWMVFIEAASNLEEQNLICFQDKEHLFYIAIRDIIEGERLKVWYSPHYAAKMNKYTLCKEEDIPCDKEQEVKNLDIKLISTLVEQNQNVTVREAWSCKFCGKAESKISNFASHLLNHYSIKLQRTCELCSASFASYKGLQKHMHIVHTNVETQEIPIRSAPTNNQISNTNKGQATVGKDFLIGGPLLLQNSDNGSLPLPHNELSQFVLSTNEPNNFESDNMCLNVDSILNENVKEMDHFNFDIKEEKIGTEELVCDICLKSFQKMRYLVWHLSQHTGQNTCFSCRKVYTRKESLKNHGCNAFYKYKCPTCGRVFVQLKYFNEHMNYSHKSEYPCKKCSNVYHNYYQLKNHKCPEKPEKPKLTFTCPTCPKKFHKRSNLTIHVQELHSSQEFACSVCSKVLSSKHTFWKHSRLHNGRKLPCTLCDKVFRRQDVLKQHIRSVHEKNVITCEVCNKTLNKKSLNKHMVRHRDGTKYNCSVCSRSFKEKFNLTRHIETQHNRTPKVPADNLITCPQCDRKFKLRQSLIKHLNNVHSGNEYLAQMVSRRPRRYRKKKTEEEDEYELDLELKETFEDIDFTTDAFDVGQKPLRSRKSEAEEEKPKSELKEGREKVPEQDELELDLKETIDNMNFITDEINDSDFELDQILDTTGIDSLYGESNEKLVESLIDITMGGGSLRCVPVPYQQNEVCLSMPDLMSGN